MRALREAYLIKRAFDDDTVRERASARVAREGPSEEWYINRAILNYITNRQIYMVNPHELIFEPTVNPYTKNTPKIQKNLHSAQKKCHAFPPGGRSRERATTAVELASGWPRGGDAIARNRFITTAWICVGSRVEREFTWVVFSYFFLFFCLANNFAFF